jgi:ataxia telangiectasia mutated family protein
MAVDLFLRNVRIKTVRAILDHITETIPIHGEGLWDHLSADYTKCLASILSYRPHAEHLDEEDWENLISFCLAGIGLRETDSQLSIRSGYRSAPEDPDASDGRSTPSRMTPAPTSREKHRDNINIYEALVLCIQLLTAVPNPPIQNTAHIILRGLIDFVKSPSIVAGNTHQLAFSSINAVITKVMFDQTELVRSTLLSLVPVIRRLWVSTKLQTLKDELLVTLMLSMIILVDTAWRDPSESLAHDVKGLANSLHSEYVRRSEKEALQIDDIIFHKNVNTKQSRPIYGPRLGNTKSEFNWTLIWIIAELLKLSEDINTRVKNIGSPRGDSNKRQRFSSELQDVLRDSISTTSTRRICALQLVPFLEPKLNAETKISFFKQLILNITDDHASVSSWTMVALARYLHLVFKFTASC